MTAIEANSEDAAKLPSDQGNPYSAGNNRGGHDHAPGREVVLFCTRWARSLVEACAAADAAGAPLFGSANCVIAELEQCQELPGTVSRHTQRLNILLLEAAALQSPTEELELSVQVLRESRIPFTSIVFCDNPDTEIPTGDDALLQNESIFLTLPLRASSLHLKQAVRRAVELNTVRHQAEMMEHEVQVQTRHLQELNRIGIALSAERDLDSLLEMILTKSRTITNSDASSLYLVEPDPAGGSRLRFKLSQNESLTFAVDRPMPISRDSLAGYVALTGESLVFDDVYQLPPGVPFSFNRSFDEAHGYRTKSMLVVPMRTSTGDIIGVVQLINRKLEAGVVLTDEATVHASVIGFTADELGLAGSIASQAAVAIENSSLYQSIENLFEGFVTASARAIEQRDPSTSGHSERVAILTLGVADVISRIERGRFAETFFTPEQIKELRYAALLHDFGKVGVREDVLLKRNKLHEHELEMLRMRFEFVSTLREKELSQRKVQALLAEDRDAAVAQFPAWDAELVSEMREMDEFLQIILRANDPLLQWMDDDSYQRQQSALAQMAHVYFSDRSHRTRSLLRDHELRALSVRRGSLDEEERREIERHVTHTYDFLRQIPWTRDYNQVPTIAYCHHERCNGSGYPRGLTQPEIPLQARIMTVVDIYDALTASDRPYKKACTPDRAIDILYDEARDGHIEREVLDVFVTYRVWRLTSGWKKRAA